MTTPTIPPDVDNLDLLRSLAQSLDPDHPQAQLARNTIYAVVSECEQLRQVEIAALLLADLITTEDPGIVLPTAESVIIKTIRGSRSTPEALRRGPAWPT